MIWYKLYVRVGLDGLHLSSGNCARDETGKILRWNDPRTARARSKTFPGIAKAMAEQWGGVDGGI